jgi:hypothetical protein
VLIVSLISAVDCGLYRNQLNVSALTRVRGLLCFGFRVVGEFEGKGWTGLDWTGGG